MWTENLDYAISSELTTKLPILTLSLVVATTPALDIKKIRVLLFLFIATVLTVSFIGFSLYITQNFTDYRDLTPYASHLYFNMMLILSAFLLPWLTLQITDSKKYIFASFIISGWLIFFLFLTRSLSGLISLICVITFLMIWLIIYHKSVTAKIVSFLIIASSTILTAWFLTHTNNLATYETEINLSSLKSYTSQNNPYYHDTKRTVRENGNLVYIHVCDEELEQQWSKKSDINYYGKDRSGHIIRYTLLRYMASKGYKKDAEHFNLLTEKDIKAVENGVTNYKYHEWPGIKIRMYETMAGLKKYRETNDPEWSTLTQRIELWKASWQALLKKPVIGWGSGNIYKAVNYGLEKNNSQLENKNMKPHNQYLVALVSLGFIGFVIFLSLYIYAIYKTNSYKLLPFNVFIIVFAVDMFGNNPLDAQYGITMFVFFTLLFGFIYPKNKKRQFSQYH